MANSGCDALSRRVRRHQRSAILTVGCNACLGAGVEPNSWREARAATRLAEPLPGEWQTQFTGAGD